MALTHLGRILTPEEEAQIPKFLKRPGRSVARLVDDLRQNGDTVNCSSQILPKEAKKLVAYIEQQERKIARLKRRIKKLKG